MKTIASQFHYLSSPQKGLVEISTATTAAADKIHDDSGSSASPSSFRSKKDYNQQDTHPTNQDRHVHTLDDDDNSSIATVRVSNTSSSSRNQIRSNSDRRRSHSFSTSSLIRTRNEDEEEEEQQQPWRRSKSPPSSSLSSSSSSRSHNNSRNQRIIEDTSTTTASTTRRMSSSSSRAPSPSVSAMKAKDTVAVDVLSLLFHSPKENSDSPDTNTTTTTTSSSINQPIQQQQQHHHHPLTQHALQSKEKENHTTTTFTTSRISNHHTSMDDMITATSDVFDGISDVASSVFSRIVEKMDFSTFATPTSTSTISPTATRLSSSTSSSTTTTTPLLSTTFKNRELQSEIVGGPTSIHPSSTQDIAMIRKARLSSRLADINNNRRKRINHHHRRGLNGHDIDDDNCNIMIDEDTPFDEGPSTLSSLSSMKIHSTSLTMHQSSSSPVLNYRNSNPTSRIVSKSEWYDEPGIISTRTQQSTKNPILGNSNTSIIKQYDLSPSASPINTLQNEEPLTAFIRAQQPSSPINKLSPTIQSSPKITPTTPRQEEYFLKDSSPNIQPSVRTSPRNTSSLLTGNIISSPVCKKYGHSIQTKSPRSVEQTMTQSATSSPLSGTLNLDGSPSKVLSDISKISFPNLDDMDRIDTSVLLTTSIPSTLESLHPDELNNKQQKNTRSRESLQNIQSSDQYKRNHTLMDKKPLKQEESIGKIVEDNNLSQPISASKPLSPKVVESSPPSSAAIEIRKHQQRAAWSKRNESTISVNASIMETSQSKDIDNGKADKKVSMVNSQSIYVKEDQVGISVSMPKKPCRPFVSLTKDSSNVSHLHEDTTTRGESIMHEDSTARGESITHQNSSDRTYAETPPKRFQVMSNTPSSLKKNEIVTKDGSTAASQTSKTRVSLSVHPKQASMNSNNSSTKGEVPSLNITLPSAGHSTKMPVKTEPEKDKNIKFEANKTSPSTSDECKKVSQSVSPSGMEPRNMRQNVQKINDPDVLLSTPENSFGISRDRKYPDKIDVKEETVSISSIGSSQTGNKPVYTGLVKAAKQKFETQGTLKSSAKNFDRVLLGRISPVLSNDNAQRISDPTIASPLHVSQLNDVKHSKEKLNTSHMSRSNAMLQQGQDHRSLRSANLHPLRSISPQFRSHRVKETDIQSRETLAVMPLATPVPRPQSKQQMMEAFYRASLSQTATSQLGKYSKSANQSITHDSDTTTMGISRLLDSSCITNCSAFSTSQLATIIEPSNHQNKIKTNTPYTPYSKVSLATGFSSFNTSPVEGSVTKIKQTEMNKQIADSINALADDLTVYTLDTIGASSLEVTFQNDEPHPSSTFLPNTGLSQSLIANLKKKMNAASGIDWPNDGPSNVDKPATCTRHEFPKPVNDVSSYEWINAVTNQYEAKRSSYKMPFLDFFSFPFPSTFYSSSSPKAAQDFPFRIDSSSTLVFQPPTILMLHFLSADVNQNDAYSIVRKIWKRFLVKSCYSDEITRCYEQIIKKDNYPFRLSVTERSITVIYNVLGLLASNNLQGAIDFLHRFLKELIQYGINHDDAITGYSYHNLGVLYFLAKRADVAQQYFIDALNIQMRHIQEPDIQTLSLLNEIGVSFFLTGQFSKALETFDEAIVLMNSSTQDVSCSICFTLWTNKAAVYYFMDDKGNSIMALNKVIELYHDIVARGKVVESSSLTDLQGLVKGIDDALRNMAFVYELLNIPSDHLNEISMRLERLSN